MPMLGWKHTSGYLFPVVQVEKEARVGQFEAFGAGVLQQPFEVFGTEGVVVADRCDPQPPREPDRVVVGGSPGDPPAGFGVLGVRSPVLAIREPDPGVLELLDDRASLVRR